MSAGSLRWGILGTAHIAELAVIPAIRQAGDQVVAVASRDPERGARFAAACQIPRLCADYRELLEAELDAVYVPLPNSLHCEWALAAIAASRHVLCEKPLALTAAEGERMRAAARAAGVVLAEAVMYRYHPRWRVVRELLAAGAIGELRHLQGAFTFPLQAPPDIRWQRALGGGALYDVGSYLVSAGRWLAGEPQRVLARLEQRRGVDVDGALLLEFAGPSPVIAELAFSFTAAEHQQLELLGTTGSLLIPKPFSAWRGEAIPLRLSRRPAGPARRLPTPAADPYVEMVAAFDRRVRGGSPLPVEPEDSVRGLRVLDAARRSADQGGWEAP